MSENERVKTSRTALSSIEGELNKLFEPPSPDARAVREVVAAKFQLAVDCVAVGNGSTELMNILTKIRHGKDAEIVASSPSFVLYEHLAKLYGYRFSTVPLSGYHHDLRRIREVVGETTRLVFLDTPANITGRTIADTDFVELLEKLPANTIVVYDNVYAEYQDTSSDGYIRDLIVARSAPVVVCRSFSKAHALFGLRIGYMLGRADLIEPVRRHTMPYGLGSLAQCAAIASIQDEENVGRNVSLNNQAKQMTYECLDRLNVPYVPTQSNALLIDFGKEIEAVEAFLSERGVRVRGQMKCGIPGHLQVFLIDPPSIRPFIEAVEEYFGRKES